jgi:hypothetical protein
MGLLRPKIFIGKLWWQFLLLTTLVPSAAEFFTRLHTKNSQKRLGNIFLN